jgi:hypothetical protein
MFKVSSSAGALDPYPHWPAKFWNASAHASNATNLLSFGTEASFTQRGFVYYDRTNTALGIAGTNALSFNTNSTVRMIINSSGNVGIGPTNPGALLHLITNNSDDSGGIRIERTSGTAGRYNEYISSSGDLTFSETAVSTRITLQKTTGNFGIGTNNPLAKLHINAGSGAISIRDYKSIVYNLDASILEGQTYQRFSIGINTSVTTYPRTSAYVRVTVVPNPDGGIGLVHSSTAEFSIWRIDGNNNANFKTISVANGTIGIATPVASGNTVIFGFTMQNNGTGTTPSFTIRIEIIAADVGNYVITPITSSINPNSFASSEVYHLSRLENSNISSNSSVSFPQGFPASTSYSNSNYGNSSGGFDINALIQNLQNGNGSIPNLINAQKIRATQIERSQLPQGQIIPLKAIPLNPRAIGGVSNIPTDSQLINVNGDSQEINQVEEIVSRIKNPDDYLVK